LLRRQREIYAPLLGPGCTDAAAGEVVVVAALEPLLAAALTMPEAPPPIARAAAVTAPGGMTMGSPNSSRQRPRPRCPQRPQPGKESG
jgi:hypothetical protein